MMLTFITDQAKDDCFAIRRKVFMQEQGFRHEFDELDARATHLCAYADDVPVGCLRYFPDIERPSCIHIGRVAVLPAYRHHHIGRKLMEQAELQIRNKGFAEIRISAQLQAMPFYQRCGYRCDGETYLDEHVLHIDMLRKL